MPWPRPAMAETLSERLSTGLSKLGLQNTAQQHDQWLAYVELIAHWNRSINLTAVREPRDMVTRHILDSLSIAPFLPEAPLLDIGTGAGLPGIPLAIYYPDRAFTLLDSNGKKTRFLFQVVRELQLPNVDIVQARVEQWRPAMCFESVTARAFSNLSTLVNRVAHLTTEAGKIFAMTATETTEQLQIDASGFVMHDRIALSVPGLEEQRHLVVVQRC